MENVILGIAMMAFIPVFFFASVYGQVALAEKATTSSLLILYFFLGFVVCAQIGGRLLDRVGAKRPVVLGCALAAVGFALWAGKATSLHVGTQVIYIVMAGAGMGLMLGQANTDAIARSARDGTRLGLARGDSVLGPKKKKKKKISITSNPGTGGQSKSLILTAMIFAVAMTFITRPSCPSPRRRSSTRTGRSPWRTSSSASP